MSKVKSNRNRLILSIIDIISLGMNMRYEIDEYEIYGYELYEYEYDSSLVCVFYHGDSPWQNFVWGKRFIQSLLSLYVLLVLYRCIRSFLEHVSSMLKRMR